MTKLNSILFLGTGTSVGIPMIGCSCEVCTSNNSKDKRLRTSALIEFEGNSFLIDIGPDFRQQMLTNHLQSVDAILLTHPHRDHIGGFDDIRALNFLQDKPIPLFCNEFTWESLQKQFYYAFSDNDYASNPKAFWTPITSHPFCFQSTEIIPIQVMHGKMPCIGFRFGALAYITDASFISEAELSKLENLDILVINSLRKYEHPSHFSLAESLEIIEKLRPKQALLTHLSHHMGLHEEVGLELPSHVRIAFDGLKVSF